MITLLGDLLIGLVLLGSAWLVHRLGSPLALPRAAVRDVLPSQHSDEAHERVARFQDQALATVLALLGLVFIVGGITYFFASALR